MSDVILRDYQAKSIEMIRAEFLRGHKKALLWLATGAGKTVIFCKMVKDASEKGRRSIVVVRGRKLVDQASVRLFRERVPHGVLMAGHWNHRPHLPIQVCSIDTLISRNLRPEADLIILDEAHLAVSAGYKEFISLYPDSYFVSVTATPWVPGGLRHVADKVIHPITMQELIDRGYLCPFRYFIPDDPDLRGVKVSSATKDYVSNDLAEVMSKSKLAGRVIDQFKKHTNGSPALCFAVNIKHSRMLTERFNEAGIAAEHCDADVPDSERTEIIRRLESGETKIVCNVGIFCTGVDIPSIGTIISARPTKSRNLFIQQAGRGTRTNPGKDHCILLDHAGNIFRHGLPTDEPEVDLDGRRKTESTVAEHKLCKSCFAYFKGSRCPECGVEPPAIAAPEIAESDEELKELTDFNPVTLELRKLLRECREKGFKRGWVYHRLVDRFGMEACKEHLPQWFISQQAQRESNPFGYSPFSEVRGKQW